MFYGWGTDHRTKQVDPSTMAVCRFKYVSVAFIFSLVWQRKWFLQGRDRAMDREITPEEIEAMYGPGSVPSPGLWKRFGVLLAPGVVIGGMLLLASAGALVGLIFGRSDETVVTADEPVAEYAEDLSSDTVDSEPIVEEDSTPTSTSESAADSLDEPANDTDEGEASSPSDDDDTVAVGSVDAIGTVALLTADQRMSTDLNDPAEDYAELTIHRAYSTNQAYYSASVGSTHLSGDQLAESGQKLLVVDLQLLAESDIGNLTSDALRLVDKSGRFFSALVNFHAMTWVGSLYNQQVMFQVPADGMSFELQGGVLDGQRDGFQTTWSIELEPGDVSTYLPDESAVLEGPVGVELLSDDNIGISGLRSEESHSALDILGAETVAKIEGSAPNLGFKWLVVDIQAFGQSQFGHISNESFRVEANGELYPYPTQINERLRTGEVWSGQLVFEIPVSATEAILEMGTPNHWPDGKRVRYSLDLP